VNETGAESFRALTHARYDEVVRGNLTVIEFGVSEYQDDAINDLKYATRDVEDLAELFSGMKAYFEDVHVHTYLDGSVIPQSIAGAQHPTVDRDNIFLKFGFPLLSR
jgi:hypothetical protein